MAALAGSSPALTSRTRIFSRGMTLFIPRTVSPANKISCLGPAPTPRARGGIEEVRVVGQEAIKEDRQITRKLLSVLELVIRGE